MMKHIDEAAKYACSQTKDRKYIEGLNKRGYSDNVDLVLHDKNQCYHAGIRDNLKWYCHDINITFRL